MTIMLLPVPALMVRLINKIHCIWSIIVGRPVIYRLISHGPVYVDSPRTIVAEMYSDLSVRSNVYRDPEIPCVNVSEDAERSVFMNCTFNHGDVGIRFK